MKIVGMEQMSPEQVNFEVQRGAKFVLFYYCVSLLVITFRRSSPIYFLRSGQSPLAKGLPWTLLTLGMGWWGIPWGPVYSMQSLFVNLKGGKDVTAGVLQALQPAQSKAGAMATAAGKTS